MGKSEYGDDDEKEGPSGPAPDPPRRLSANDGELLRCRFPFGIYDEDEDDEDGGANPAEVGVGVDVVELDERDDTLGFRGISRFNFDLSITRSCSRLIEKVG